MDIAKKIQLKELLKLNIKLRSLYDNDEYFKKLYESCNKKNNDDIEDEYITLTMGNGRNILSEVPMDVIDSLNSIGAFNDDIFDSETRTITVSDYWSLIETVKYLIDILKCDLSDAFFNDDRIEFNLPPSQR